MPVLQAARGVVAGAGRAVFAMLRAMVLVVLGFSALFCSVLGAAALLLAAGPERLPEYLAPVADTCRDLSAFSMCTSQVVSPGTEPLNVETWLAHVVPALNCAFASADLAPEPWCRMRLRVELEEAVAAAMSSDEIGMLVCGLWVGLSLSVALFIIRSCQTRQLQGAKSSAALEAAPPTLAVSNGEDPTLAKVEKHGLRLPGVVTKENAVMPNIVETSKGSGVAVKQSKGRMKSPAPASRVRTNTELPRVPLGEVHELNRELQELRGKGLVAKILKEGSRRLSMS